MNKWFQFILSLSGLCALWYMSIKDNNINYIILIPALAIVWNALSDSSKVEVKEYKNNDLEIKMLKLRIANLEAIVRASELVEKSSDMVIRDLQKKLEVENK